MQLHRSIFVRLVAVIALIASLTILSNNIKADTGSCSGVTITLPFNDVMASPFFCQIAASYYSGLTNGTTATTYSPGATVTREQMAAFISRTLDQSLKRGSKRAVAKKWWTPQTAGALGVTILGSNPQFVETDGTDLWVADSINGTVSRVRASDGKLLETWTGANNAFGILAAMGRIFVIGSSVPGKLYQIDPTQPAGVVTTITSSIGNFPTGIGFDGARIWTANTAASVSILTLNPLSVNTVTGFTTPIGILYDGANMWVTDEGTTPGNLFKLDSNGSIIQTVAVGNAPRFAVFDGTNIWVPNNGSNSVTVVRASTGAVVATLTGNGLSVPVTAAFDGERILVTNVTNSVSLWKAADLTPLGSVSTGPDTQPYGACSDGLNFWIALYNAGRLARF